MGKQTLRMTFHFHLMPEFIHGTLFYLQHILAWRLNLFIAYHNCSSTSPRLPSSVAQYIVVLRCFVSVTPAATVLKEITLAPNNCIFVLAIHGSLLFSVCVAHSLSLTVVTSRPPLIYKSAVK
jgi:hypothetical protein